MSLAGLKRRAYAGIRRLLRPLVSKLVDEIIHEFGKRVVNERLNINLFNWRFHDTELATRNINNPNISRRWRSGSRATAAS